MSVINYEFKKRISVNLIFQPTRIRYVVFASLSPRRLYVESQRSLPKPRDYT